jgi:hypothetical protein
MPTRTDLKTSALRRCQKAVLCLEFTVLNLRYFGVLRINKDAQVLTFGVKHSASVRGCQHSRIGVRLQRTRRRFQPWAGTVMAMLAARHSATWNRRLNPVS